MTYQLLLTKRAEAEINRAAAWYERQRVGLGDDFENAVDDELEAIRQAPLINAVTYKNIRIALMSRFPYLIYYRVVRDRAVVVQVLHARRNITP